jgi:hypothetical protein
MLLSNKMFGFVGFKKQNPTFSSLFPSPSVVWGRGNLNFMKKESAKSSFSARRVEEFQVE